MNKYLEAEKELAIALGYTNFQRWESNGMPVSGHIDGVVTPLKQWARDGAAFDLMVEHNVHLTFAGDFGVSTYIDGDVEGKLFDYTDYQSKQDCVRYAIVQAVIAKLKGK